MKKLKIAFFMPQIIMGGAETCLLRLITALKKFGYEISIVTKVDVYKRQDVS